MDKKKAAEGLKVHGICKNEYFVNFCLCFLLSGLPIVIFSNL